MYLKIMSIIKLPNMNLLSYDKLCIPVTLYTNAKLPSHFSLFDAKKLL